MRKILSIVMIVILILLVSSCSFTEETTSPIDVNFINTTCLKIKATPDIDALTTSCNVSITIDPILSGKNLIGVMGAVYTAATSGTPTFTITNTTDSTNMLSSNITIDANEKNSSTAVNPAVINTLYDDIITGDIVTIQCTTTGTGTKGMEITLWFRNP